jgi:hypothetical protein
MNTVDSTRLVAVDTDRNEVLQSYPLTLSDRAYPMDVDEANHRLFLGCRNKPGIVVVDSESDKEVTSVAILIRQRSRSSPLLFAVIGDQVK